MSTDKKKIINSIGWKFALFMFLTLLFQFAGSAVIKTYFPNLSSSATMNLSYAMVIISVDFIALPIAYFSTKRMEKFETEKNKIPFWQYLIGIAICFFLMIAGGVIGNIFNMIATGTNMSPISVMMSSSNLWIQALVIGINAPIMEEIIFRKIMIDRLGGVGKWFAIVVSSVAFALYHGNFAQFFYAFGLGMFFGYVYSKTGKILYSIGYHMIINMTGTLITNPLAMKADLSKGLLASCNWPYLIWIAILYSLAFTGFVLLIVFIKKFRLNEEGSEVKGFGILKELFTNWGLWLAYIACGLVFIVTIISTRNLAVRNSLGGEVVTDFRFTQVVTVSDNEADREEDTFYFTVAEDGQYIVSVDYYDNVDPAFVTCVAIEDADGNCIDWFCGGRANVSLVPKEYKAGSYTARFKYAVTEDEALQWVADRSYVYPDYKCPELPYEYFGDTGTYTMNYKFVLKKSK